MQALVNFAILQLDKLPTPLHCEFDSDRRSQIRQDLCRPILPGLPNFAATKSLFFRAFCGCEMNTHRRSYSTFNLAVENREVY